MNNLDLLDILTILSFALQVQNQGHIIDMNDLQEEIGNAVNEIHKHLAIQDVKINKVLKLLEVQNADN